ncbi:MAG: DnaJ domain-containing protein [bacterium]
MARNYYIILGVKADATHEEIKAAYRRLAKELHPDRSGKENPQFLEVQEAYTVVGDRKKRRQYDREIQATHIPVAVKRGAHSPIEAITPTQKPSVFEEVFITRSFEPYTPSFEEIFHRLWRNFTGRDRPKGERPESLTVEVPLTQEQARRGGYARVMIPVHSTCPMCHGSGGIGFFRCLRCDGMGYIDGEVPIRVPYPAGIVTSYAVNVSLERFGIQNVYLTIHFRVHG